jgi:hypothetical protein
MLTFVLYCLGSLVASFLQESLGADFSDLGRKLLGGFAVAVVVAIVFTIIKLRLRDRRPAAKFISVTSCPDEDVARNSVDD